MYAADEVWRVIGDWVAGPVNMAPGSVVSSYVDGGARVVMFASGTVARERLIARDETARRIVYSLIGDTVRPEHDNAAMQIIADGAERCRLVWSRDVLRDELADPLLAAMEAAVPLIKQTFESGGYQRGGAAPRPKPHVD